MTHRDEQRALLLDVLTLRWLSMLVKGMYVQPKVPVFRPFMARR